MGITDSLKDLYFGAEDKYYAILDKLNQYLPVYKIIDPIDKVVPSFILLIILVVLVFGALFVLPAISLPGQVSLVIAVEDEDGNPLGGVSVNYRYAAESGSKKTNEKGEIELVLSRNTELKININETVVKGTAFDGIEKTITVSEEKETIVLKRKVPLITERTLILQYPSGERITDKTVTVRLSCSTGVTPLPQEVTDTDRDGVIIVKEPPNCGVMQATVVSPAEFAGMSYLLDKDTVILRFEKEETAAGHLRVKVKDASGRLLDDVSFEVTLRDSDGADVQSKYTQYYGEVIFRDIAPGTYGVTVSDESNEYAIAREENIEIRANETESITVVVSKSVKGTLKVKAVDSVSHAEIPNATIRLVDSTGKIVEEEKTSETGEAAEFAILDEDNYTLYAIHDDYLYGEYDLNGAITGSIEIEMELLTPQNSGRIEVKVIDEDNAVVENAKVKLRFLENDFIAPYPAQITDFNGVARFRDIKEGSYYAYVEKFPAFGDNKEQDKRIDIREITYFTVSIFIGESTVSVEAVDEDNIAIAEAEAEFFSIMGKSLGRIPLADGKGSYALKADKMVYVLISHPDFQAVQTMPRQLYPGKTINFKVVMIPRRIAGKPEIEFLGIYSMADVQVQKLDAGQRYIAKFRFNVPEAEEYSKGGIHFRIGDTALLANDPLIIKDVFAGNINAPLKGTTFTPPLGYEEDVENLTEGDAKWINIEWQELPARDYFIGFEIRVKGQITPGTMLPMHYRAWAVNEAGEYVRDPFDSVLGTAESISAKQSLYAMTYDLQYYEGQDAVCEEDFCYSGKWVYGEEEGLYIYEPYSIKIHAPYTFNFSILNNSETQYSNSQLFVKSLGKDLEINSYEIVDADAKTITATALKVFEIPNVALGNFTKGKSVRANIKFKPRELTTDSFEIRVVADGKVVFLKVVSFAITAEKQMEITFEPEYVGSYAPVDLIVTVKEIEEHGLKLELKDALVRVTRISPDRSRISLERLTNALGKAAFTIPGSHPNTVIEIEAEKPGYAAAKVSIIVDSNVLSFDPPNITSNLNTRSIRETKHKVTIKNKTWNTLIITDVKVSGKFKGFLDEAAMEAYLEQFVGTELAAFSEEEYQLFLVRLSQYALDNIREAERLQGEFVITVENPAILAEYDFTIPLRVNIALGGMPDNAPCLILTQKEWKSVTTGNKATLEFEIQNSCMDTGGFMALENLQGRMQWQSDVLGVVELSITEAETGASNTEVLRPKVWSTFFRNIRPDSTYYAMLTFTPKAGRIGKTAEFFIEIDGQVLTDAGLQFVGSDPNRISSNIKIINLDSCITYPDVEDIVKIKAEQSEAKFTISSEECGETSVDLILCYNDPGCRGGASEGNIGVTPQTFTLTPEKPTREIMVERHSIAGMYGLTVSAKLPGGSYAEARTIDVLVETEPEDTFSLDKYQFTIIGNGAKDSATLTNNELSEQVNVRASLCAWGEAHEKGNFSPAGALAGAGLGFAIGVLAPAGTFATIGPAILGLAFCPPCLVIMIVLAVIVGFLFSFMGADPCAEYMTNPLPDWVINLTDDARDITLDRPGIEGSWNTDVAKVFGEYERQTVGIVFENVGIEEVKPTYTAARVSALKHYHAQPTNYGQSSDFGTFKVKDMKTEVYTQVFHLKFITKFVPQQIPPINYETYACVQGTMIGRTGPGALPRTKLTWSWNEADIPINACDYSNPEHIYCDATQFSITIGKKIHAIDEFLRANIDKFGCPENPAVKRVQEISGPYQRRQVADGNLGLVSATPTITGRNVSIDVEIRNNTNASQSGTITVEVFPEAQAILTPEQKKCEKPFSIAMKSTMKVTCNFANMPNGLYPAYIILDSTTTTFIDGNILQGGFRVLEEYGEKDCWLSKSTTVLDGKSAIEYFIDAAPAGITWTNAIQNKDNLREFLTFKATLMADGYSEDFQKDFVDYSITKDFFNAPYWFSDDPSGRLADYFNDRSHLYFTGKYVNSDQLPTAGIYEVHIDMNFANDKWALYDAQGKPAAKIKIEFYLVDRPFPDSIFYYLPLNGNIGVESPNGRQDYGMDYQNENERIIITSVGDFIATDTIPSSAAYITLNTKAEYNFKAINSDFSNRGLLLKINEGEAVWEKNMSFSPNYATPAVMRMKHGKSDEPFSAFYQLLEAGTPVETGGNLTFWDGAGQCLDYTGVPVFEAFDYTPDREGKEGDPVTNWQFLYAVDWDKANYAGDVYLKTVIYTPINKAYSIKASSPQGMGFITPNSPFGNAMDLDGIQGMPHNSKRGEDKITELREIFDLVESQHICVTNSGVETAFWWNPKVLYETKGAYTSVKDFEMGLRAGENCIGYGS